LFAVIFPELVKAAPMVAKLVRMSASPKSCQGSETMASRKSEPKEADTNGLTPASERMLKRRLVEVSALASRPAYFSHQERTRILALEKELANRIVPTDPEALEKKAKELLAYHAGISHDWVQAALIECLP
jgi:hypothetical protein